MPEPSVALFASGESFTPLDINALTDEQAHALIAALNRVAVENVPLWEVEALSVRLENVLRRASLSTVARLRDWATRPYPLPNMGARAYHELAVILRKHRILLPPHFIFRSPSLLRSWHPGVSVDVEA